MQDKNIALVSHVNPFSSGSGQVERVFNTLIALALVWDNITLYTTNEYKSDKRKIDYVTNLNKNLKIKYVENNKPSLIVSIYFKIMPYLGFGKESNFSIPFIFNKIQNELALYDVVLFEYWHLYKLSKKLREKGIYTICDTHNVLLNSYKQFITNKKWLPQIYKFFLINKYERLEFGMALKDSFDMLIAINKEEEKIFKIKFPKQKVYYFPMGIKLKECNLKNERLATKENYTILYYGGLGSERNLNACLEVIDALKSINSLSIKLKIIGSNPPIFLKKYVSRNDDVTLYGYVENLEHEFQDIDLAVIPFEGKYGFRSRLIEIIHFGIPILTTKDGVWGMGFTNSMDIILYENNLSKNIESALIDYNLRQNVIVNAKKKIEQEFTFEKTYLKFSSDLIEIINK